MQALQALGVNATYFYQLGIVILFYYLLKQTLFKKLQSVVETREAQTTKRTHSASEKLAKVEELKSTYNEKITLAHRAAQTELSNRKMETVRKETIRFKDSEHKLSQELEAKRAELKNAIGDVRKKSLSQAEGLSQELVTKITH
jgi:F-type H+-transporting ATPase subunit b